MRDLLWTPSKERRQQSRMMKFMHRINQKYQQNFNDYRELQAWSVQNIEACWAEIWDEFQIIASRPYTKVVDDPKKMPGADWFSGAVLNYTENILRCNDADIPAIIFRGESGTRREINWQGLQNLVKAVAQALRKAGIQKGDFVAGYMPNLPETVIAMLASAAIGAVWCSCATDIGPEAAVDRLGQVSPKLLFTVDGYSYKGKLIDVTKNAAVLAEKMTSLQKVVVTHFCGDEANIANIKHAQSWNSFVETGDIEGFTYEQLPASSPLVVMFSSGTTGKPKCMVQSHAGILLNQMKEIGLHHDLGPNDRLLYITSCSWMMWNWMLAALGVGTTLVLFDGNPSYPATDAIWKILEEEKVTCFGLSATYIHSLMSEGFIPKDHADLSALQSISQTGSALSDAGFHFVYEKIKDDLHFNSIAGGTDINGCFCTGNPLNPVYSNELQGPGLGDDLAAFDETGKPVFDVQGELVCRQSVPSMPLYFWGDPEGKRYHAAYFEVYPRVWRHGDYVQFHSDTGGVTYYGRSDSVLKPSGVRIGSSEIYTQVQKVDEVLDSLAAGQDYHNDQRVLLFVQLKPEISMTKELARKIRTTIRQNASPRHVPAVIIPVHDVPKTLNGKLVESAVINIVNHRTVTNRDALQNPASLDEYIDLLPYLEGKIPDDPANPRLF